MDKLSKDEDIGILNTEVHYLNETALKGRKSSKIQRIIETYEQTALDPIELNFDTLEEFIKEFDTRKNTIFRNLDSQEIVLEKIKSFDMSLYKSL